MSGTHAVTVGPKGRLVIPAEVRRELGIVEGTQLAVVVEGDAVVLLPRSAVKARLRAMFADLRSSMAQELIEERRAAAAEESRR
jgi:AbrB family looped-hinge helix DNA binding protein